ncbi:MAG TPA: hypothetical protein VI321_03140 [Burkholderiales bacterium]
MSDQAEIIVKLREIEEQARRALADPNMAKERLRLILGIAGHLALKLEIETSDIRQKSKGQGLHSV